MRCSRGCSPSAQRLGAAPLGIPLSILTPVGHGERGEALEKRNSTSLCTSLKGPWDMLVLQQQKHWDDGRQLSTCMLSWGLFPRMCPAAELGQAKGQEERASGCA